MKQTKKFAALLLAAAMLVTILPFGAIAQAETVHSIMNAETNHVQSVIDAIAELPAPADLTVSDKDIVYGVKALYDALTQEEQAMVYNFATLQTAIDTIEARLVERLFTYLLPIENLGLADSEKVNVAHAAYDALTPRQRALVNPEVFAILGAADRQIALSWDEVYAVEALIDALPIPPVSTGDREAIDEAREAYDALDEAQQAEVRNYWHLELAEADLTDAVLREYVMELINSIPEIIMPEDEQVIINAREAYDLLADNQKQYITNYDYLVESEEILAVVLNVANINEYVNAEDAVAIENAREAYDAVAEDKQYRVGNYSYLVDSETVLEVVVFIDTVPFVLTAENEQVVIDAREAYEELETLKTRVGNYTYLNDSESVMVVVLAIESVSEVEATIANKELFLAVEQMYIELGEALQPRVGNYKSLADILVAIEELETEIDDSLNLIDEIPYVLMPDDKETVDAARAAYDSLTDEQKTYVTNYEYLVESEGVMIVVNLINEIPETILPEDQDVIETAREGYIALEAVDRVGNYNHLVLAETALPVVLDIAEIAEIPLDEILLEDTDRIREVEADYSALSDEAKEYVGNYDALVDALNRLDELWEQVFNTIDLLEIVYDMNDRPLYPEDNAAIEAAREAYDALNDNQKNYIIENNPYLLPALVEAETIMVAVIAINAIPKPLMPDNQQILDDAYAAYFVLSESSVDMQERVGNAENLFAACDAMIVVIMIDGLELDPVMIAYAEQISEIRLAYEELSELAKEYVGNYEDLLFAESELDRLWAEINHVIDLIDTISFPVTLSDASTINEARAAYDALTEEQQGYVTNYARLCYAERELTTLYSQVAIVMACITALPYQVNLDDADTIAAIWRTYNSLTHEQQEEVTNLPKLINATNQIQALQDQIESVEELINAIPETVTEENFDEFVSTVTAAREAYDAIVNPIDAGYVKNYRVLLAAEEVLAFITEVEAVIDLIEALPDRVNLQDKEDVEAAREAYDALNEEQKALVSNYDVLVAAEEMLFNIITEVEAVIDLINLLGDTAVEYLDLVVIRESFEEARDAFDALSDDQKSMVENADRLETIRSYYAEAEEGIEAIAPALEISATSDDLKNALDYIYSGGNELEENQRVYVLDVLGYGPDWTEIVEYISNLYYGDVDGDGRLTFADAILLMRAVMESDCLDETKIIRYDISGDGIVTIVDAIVIMRLAMNIA